MINVIVSTYIPDGEVGEQRAKYLHATVKSLRDRLMAPQPIRFILANDGPVNQPEVLYVGNDVLAWHKVPWTVTGGERVGLGGSLNRALGLVEGSDLWMYTTDDWLLTEMYNLRQAVQLLVEDGYDCVRLGPPHPNVAGQIKFRQGIGWWLELWPRCGYYTFATRPFVANRNFFDTVGPFKEQCDAYAMEKDYAERVVEDWYRVSMAEVVNGSLEGPWKHVGEVEVGDRWP